MHKFTLTRGILVTDVLGQPIHVLSLALRDEYRLYSPKPPAAVDPAMQQWIQNYPLAWAETAGVGLAKQRPPIVVELKCYSCEGETVSHEPGGPARNYATHPAPPKGRNSQNMRVPMEYSPITCEKAQGNRL